MNTARERYAAARLTQYAAALQAFRAVRGGAYHITLLTPGMQHTAFTDIRGPEQPRNLNARNMHPSCG